MIESENDLTKFFEFSVDMLCIAGVDGYFKRINPAFLTTLGYEEKTLLEKPFIEFVHPDDVAITLAELLELATGEPTINFENRYMCKNGEYKWLSWTAFPVDRVLYCVARDITLSKQLEQEVKDSHVRFRAILEMASVGILIINRDGQILISNPKVEAMFGYLDGELQGAAVEQLLPEQFVKSHERHRDTYFKQPAVREMGLKSNLAGKRKDGLEFPVEVSLSYMETNLGLLAMAFLIDISDRRRVEQEREKLIGELEAFAHTVAHDLKTPLGLILGYADLLHSSTEDLRVNEIKEQLEVISRMSRKMNDIINALLLLATVRNQEKIDSKPVDMQTIVYEAKARLAHMIEAYEATILLPTSWPSVQGNAPWIEEVWINYLSNAIKYGGLPPHLEIGVTVEESGMVRYWVRDNGEGLSKKEQQRLFTPFTRLKPDEKRGHGLGLSIVKRIVEKLGGNVGVESEPGVGSTFYFSLPQAPKRSNEMLS